MSSLLAIFMSAFAVGFSGAMAPGPVLTVTINESLKRGFWAGPLIVLGHAILEIILLLLMAAGLAPFFENAPVKIIFLSAGGVVLAVMGVKMLAGNKKAAEETLHTHGPESPYGPILAGIVLSISNPFWIIWWGSVGMGFVTQALEFGLIGLLCFYLGHILSDLTWYSFVAFTVSAGRRLCPPLAYRLLFSACGLIMMGLGANFIIQAIKLIVK